MGHSSIEHWCVYDPLSHYFELKFLQSFYHLSENIKYNFHFMCVLFKMAKFCPQSNWEGLPHYNINYQWNKLATSSLYYSSWTLFLATLRHWAWTRGTFFPFQGINPGSMCLHLCNFWTVSHKAKAACSETVGTHLY